MKVQKFTWYVSKGNIELAEDAFQKHAFEPCIPTAQMSDGWVKPLGRDTFVMEGAGNCQVLMYKKQTKKLPAQVITNRVNELCAEFEAREGYVPKRKLRQQMKEDAILYLLPKAFSTDTLIPVVIMNRVNRLFIMSDSSGIADDIAALLRETILKLPISLPRTVRDSSHVLTHWIEEAPEDFDLGEKIKVDLIDVEGGTLKASNIGLDSGSISKGLEEGFQVDALVVDWREMVSMKINSDLTLSKIKVIADDDTEFDKDGPEDAKYFHELGVFATWVNPFLDVLVKSMGGLEEALLAVVNKANES